MGVLCAFTSRAMHCRNFRNSTTSVAASDLKTTGQNFRYDMLVFGIETCLSLLQQTKPYCLHACQHRQVAFQREQQKTRIHANILTLSMHSVHVVSIYIYTRIYMHVHICIYILVHVYICDQNPVFTCPLCRDGVPNWTNKSKS